MVISQQILLQWHSPLNWALLGGHLESAKVLLQHGASIDCFHEVSIESAEIFNQFIPLFITYSGVTPQY